MIPQSIIVDQLQIAYLEVNENAKNTIFFIHGNSGSSRSWLRQLGDPLLKEYRMIAFDLPAHGDSAASGDPETDYSLPALGKRMAEAIKALAAGEDFILVGFSLGSNVLAEALTWVRPAGIVLTGSSVAGGKYTMDKVFQPGLDGSVFFSDSASAESIRQLAGNISYGATEAAKQVTLEDYNKVKAGFRPALIKTVIEGKMNDEISLLQQAGLPVLVIFGREDRMVNPDYLNEAPFTLWKNKVFQLPEAGHTAHIDQAALFDQLVAEYAGTVADH